MPDYTIYLHTDEVSVPSMRVYECVDDAEALRRAESELSYSRTAHWAEVRVDDRVIGMLGR